jgi:hypothetical protein
VAASPTSPPLVTGLVSGGGWEYVRAWVTSLRGCGYQGEIALVTVDGRDGLREQCARFDVKTIEADPADLVTRHLSDPYNGRHSVLAGLLEERYEDHFVLACDTRDLVFQTDPFEFFQSGGRAEPDKLHVVSEEVVFDQDESKAGRWGAAKVAQLFSPRERAQMRGLPSYNIGILCGPAQLVAGMNVIMQTEPWRSSVARLGVADGWAVHFAAVKLGLVSPAIAPRIEDGLVKTVDGKPFSIVHQYDRARRLRKLVEERLQQWDAGDIEMEAQ